MVHRIALLTAALLSLPTFVHAQQVKPSCTDNSRDCLIAAARSYFDALATHDASKVPFAPNVRRTEQGHVSATDETRIREHTKTQPDMAGHFNDRYVVDEKTGNVVGFTLLKVTGKKADPNRKSVTDGRPELARPATVHVAERFKVVNGLITEIEALFYTESGTMEGVSNWPD